MKRVPDSFGTAQLESLRLLARIALLEPGSAGRQSRPAHAALIQDHAAAPISATDIGHFVRGPNTLGWKRGGSHGEKLHALYDLIWTFYQKRDNAVRRSQARPLIDFVYGETYQAALNHEWHDAVTDEAIERSKADGSRLGPRLVGAYRTYRRGTHYHANDGGEIVMSPMIIRAPSDAGGPYTFDIIYPPREEGYDPAGLGITGHLIFTDAHTYLIGHDRGSGSPYLMIIRTPPIEASGHHGIALRSTTDNVVVAARVYLKRSQEDWSAIRLSSSISLVSRFTGAVAEDAKDILRYTRNEIDNDFTFVLKRYEHRLGD